MKNRKFLAFVLSLALIITLIPASAFAGSTNSVDRVTTVAADEAIPTVTLYLEADQAFTSTGQSIKLSLTNATWARDVAAIRTTPQGILITGTGNTTSGALGASIGLVAKVGAPGLSGEAISVTDTTAEFRIKTTTALTKGAIIALELRLVAGGDEGEVKVTLDRLNSNFSDGTYTVAIVGSGKTTTTVVGTPVTTWRGSFTGNVIEIRENAVNSIKTGVEHLKFTLPNGMTWNGATFRGDLIGNPATNVTYTGIGSRDLEVTMTTTAINSAQQVLAITPDITIGKTAKLGDVAVALRGGTDIGNASGLVVGVYVEENVKVYTVKEANLPEIIAGREYSDDFGGNDPYEVEITVEEDMASALVAGRFIEFDFPKYVQIVSDAGVKVKATGSGGNNDSEAGVGGYPHNSDWDNAEGTLSEDTSSFEYTLPDNILTTGSKDKFVFTIPVTVEAGTPAGDLTVKVSGSKAGVAETDLVVGKILAPVSVELKMADIRAGIQKQNLGEIIIKENFAGALMEANLDVIIDDDLRGSIKDYEVAVLSGDLELDEDAISVPTGADNTLRIPIDRESIKTPGEIKISGLTYTVDRTPAEGKYVVDIGGTALVTNTGYNKDDFSSSVVSEDFINVITLADANLYGEAKFVIGEKNYTVYVNGVLEERTMDVAPYIDSANRTMVPIRYAANSLGVPDGSIFWDAKTKTATVLKGDRVIVITVGKNVITVNGSSIPMDTVAVVKDSRVYVPLAYLATALGAKAEWDGSSKTVSLVKN